MKEITIKAAIENLDSVLEFIGSEMEKKDISIKLQNDIKLAAEEIFVNIAYYAYTVSGGSAVVRIDVGSEITVEFKDSGTQYNPLANKDPDISVPAEEREIGGMGIFMVKKIMDTIDYRYENGYNILTIKKRV